MADLETFEAEVNKQIKTLLKSKNAAERHSAAVWLGEAGEPSAITALARAYKDDKDKKVREASSYSLGMFRALEIALDDPDKEEDTLKLLEDIALYGKMGKRAGGGGLKKIVIVLFLLLVVLGIANVVTRLDLSSLGTPPADGTPVAAVDDRDQATLLVDLRLFYNSLFNDTNSLMAQYQGILGGSSISCQTFFNVLTPYQMSANNSSEYPALKTIADNLNTALDNFNGAKVPFDGVCNDGQPLPPDQVGAPMGVLVTLSQTDLPAINTALTEAETAAIATPIPPTAETVIETPTAEVTVVSVNIRPHMVALQTIVSDMTAPRGPNNLLDQYWREALSGATDGCTVNRPTIAEDYVLPQDVIVSSSNLDLANKAVNNALVQIRQGWDLFATACSTGNPGASSNTGLQFTARATQFFDTATGLLALVRDEAG